VALLAAMNFLFVFHSKTNQKLLFTPDSWNASVSLDVDSTFLHPQVQLGRSVLTIPDRVRIEARGRKRKWPVRCFLK
jgi:hypothetical protein